IFHNKRAAAVSIDAYLLFTSKLLDEIDKKTEKQAYPKKNVNLITPEFRRQFGGRRSLTIRLGQAGNRFIQSTVQRKCWPHIRSSGKGWAIELRPLSLKRGTGDGCRTSP